MNVNPYVEFRGQEIIFVIYMQKSTMMQNSFCPQEYTQQCSNKSYIKETSTGQNDVEFIYKNRSTIQLQIRFTTRQQNIRLQC